MKTIQILIISSLIGVAMPILMQFPFASSKSGSLTGFDARSPDLSNMSLIVYDKFDQVSPNSTKNLYLEFFDEKNKTLVKNVSFFVNATKGDTVLIHELFFTHTGSMTLKFSPGSNTGKYVINGTAEPVLGGIMSNNDILPIEMSAFTPGTYHFHIEVLALVYTNGIADQTNPPTFDSWWSVDDKGNISKDTNSTISKIKNASPLQQFKSGVTTQNITCREGFILAIKKQGHQPACVDPDTVSKLVLRGWSENPLDGILLKYGNQTQANLVFYDILNEPKIRDWSMKGWRYSDYSYASNGETGQSSATVHLYLPSGIGKHECENGSYGFVVVNLKPVKIEHNYTEAGCEIATTTATNVDPESNGQ